MDYTTLGRTGLKVSVAGLGCGGHSRLGMSYGRSEAEAASVVRRAVELGVNFIDTAETYGTEPAVGAALADLDRDSVVISTKKCIKRKGERLGADEMIAGLEASLERLGTEFVDVYHLHALYAEDHDYAVSEIVPALETARDAGKLRHIGVTEMFGRDCGHEMFRRAAGAGCWDVFMVGFNILNQCARDRVYAAPGGSIEKDVGVLVMFALRQALSKPERLVEVVAGLVDEGLIDQGELDPHDPLGWLVHPDDGGACSIQDAGYRFCRHEAGVHVVLTGTGSVEHLEQNVASILRPPLSEADAGRLARAFRRVDCVAGN